jgi:hypothetical protein
MMAMQSRLGMSAVSLTLPNVTQLIPVHLHEESPFPLFYEDDFQPESEQMMLDALEIYLDTYQDS